MADQKSFPTRPTNTVDWNDPHLESLLNKTDGWQLDNRGSIPPLAIQIQFGWGAGVSKPALLVWENEEAMVLETGFPIERGELIRVDKPEESGRPSQWGEVIESRPGRRSDDKIGGIQVHWLRLR